MKEITILNPNWIKDKGIDKDGVSKIQAIHAKRIDLFNRIEKETNKEKLHEMAKEIDDIDFALQDAWGFPKDIKYHTWWYRLPKCKCPRMDNRENVGTNEKIISGDCPLHGSEE